MWVRALVGIAILASTARADDCDPDCRIAKIRALLDRGEQRAARDELLALYSETNQAQLLFALGQVELQLERYQAAIDYYERFIATNPGEDQIALAQQAIGAARMKITQPKAKPIPTAKIQPPPRYERRWDRANTLIVIAGGAALAVGGGLLLDAHLLGNDATGTLAEYDDRLEHAHARRFGGVGALAAGTIAISVAVVRWRLDRTEVRTEVHAGGGMITVGRRW